MNPSKLLSSFFNCLIALYFIVCGTVLLLAPQVEAVQQRIVAFIQKNTLATGLFGAASLLAGGALLIYTLLSSRHNYYRLKGGARQVYIDENLIRQYLATYWENLLPGHETPCSISVQNNTIHVSADLPRVALERQKTLLEQIEADLTELFAKNLGYQKEYTLSISFQE